jgi:hypothetical protein
LDDGIADSSLSTPRRRDCGLVGNAAVDMGDVVEMGDVLVEVTVDVQFIKS